MKGTGNREQGTEDLKRLLRSAATPVGEDADPGRDLWPAMRRRLNPELNQESGLAARLRVVPWFDWALAGGVALFAVAAPASIPVLLYYL
jgi:hypothetical protein